MTIEIHLGDPEDLAFNSPCLFAVELLRTLLSQEGAHFCETKNDAARHGIRQAKRHEVDAVRNVPVGNSCAFSYLELFVPVLHPTGVRTRRPHSTLQLYADVFRLGEELEGLEDAFASDAALAHAAEGEAQIAQQAAVDPERAAVDGGSDTVGALQIGRKHRRRQPIARGVRKRDRLFLAVERSHRHDRPEDLFLQHAAIHAEPGDDRRLDEVAAAVDAIPAADDRPAFPFRELDVAGDFPQMIGADQRADIACLVERIADLQLLRGSDEALEELVVSGALDEDARAAETDLALIPEAGANRRRDRVVEIG